jgi:hypothetical protein
MTTESSSIKAPWEVGFMKLLELALADGAPSDSLTPMSPIPAPLQMIEDEDELEDDDFFDDEDEDDEDFDDFEDDDDFFDDEEEDDLFDDDDEDFDDDDDDL